MIISKFFLIMKSTVIFSSSFSPKTAKIRNIKKDKPQKQVCLQSEQSISHETDCFFISSWADATTSARLVLLNSFSIAA